MEIETFSRALGKLKNHGIIVQGSHVAIENPESVDDYVCSYCSVAEECPTHRAVQTRKISGH